MNDISRLKILGYLPNINLANLVNVQSYASVGADQDHPILSGRTCGTPDFADAEIANATPKALSDAIGEDEDLCECYISTHKKMLAATTGRGSFPAGCVDKYPGRHAATYYVDRGSFNAAHYHRTVTEAELSQAAVYFRISASEATNRYGKLTMMNLALKMLEESYRRVGIALIEILVLADANIHILTRNLGPGTIGMAQFNDGTCGDQVKHWIETSYRPSLMSFAHLLTHECGHNNNLEHEFSNQNTHHSVMSYSPKQPFVGFSKGETDRPDDVSLPVLRKYYGDEPIPSPDLPPPGPVLVPEFIGDLSGDHSPSGEIAIRANGLFVVIKEGQKPGRYPQILVPSDELGRFHFEPKL